MRTLRDFLLAETKKEASDNKNKQLPPGFTIISNRGSLTKEAQEAMGARNWSSAMDIAATKDPAKIKKSLGTVSGNDPYSILKGIMKNDNDLDEVFEKSVGRIPNVGDSIVLQFISNDWTTLARTSSSSQRLVKFWINSALQVYGDTASGKRTYAVNEDTDQFLVF